MDKTAGSEVSDQKASLIQQIAAGIYYQEAGTTGEQFEKLTAETLKPWFEKAARALTAIEKVNMVLVPQVQLKSSEEVEVKHLENLVLIIEGFVKKLNTTKPALFPSRELAIRILDGKA